jgi:uncharacterized membrane protein YeiH
VIEGFNPTLILALSLAGTFVFGLSGGGAAARAHLDIFGVIVLSGVVALAGGIVRDLLIGTPPETFRDWRYLVAAGAAGVVCFFALPLLDRVQNSVLVFDAMGLSLFCVAGASKALDFHLGPVQAVILGTITGIGGGMLRDVLLRQVPGVLGPGDPLYAIPAVLGATILVLGHALGSTNLVFPLLGAAACLALRLVSIQFRIGLPVPRSVRGKGNHDEDDPTPP